ncbi:MAG: hypothetical protein Q4C85_06310 [Actinomyces sp.]|uniref:hypothetical protein n=1 Tax=Actinomyces sp. TaxID=29317 RepID=UPI0026DC8285|nr:hypothetical protein [Actinomyces sp.]MDO4243361.1 hypothetical protein [Actinomyces sp.]
MGSSASAAASRPARLRRIAALAALAVGLPALAACGDQVPVPGPTSPSTVAEQTPDVQETTAPTEDAPTESGGEEYSREAAVWSIPVTAEGWYLTTWDTDGVNQLDNDAGCSFTTHQNYYTGGLTDDREATESMVEPAMAAWDNSGSSGLVYDTSDDVDTIRDMDGIRLESIRMDFSYTSGDGTMFTGVEWVRVFTDKDTPVELRVSYVCPTDAYSDLDLAELVEDTTVINPGTPDMEA